MKNKFVSILTLLIIASNAFAQTDYQNVAKSLYIVDTVTIENPISVAFEHSKSSIGLFTSRGNLEYLTIQSPNVYLSPGVSLFPEIDQKCNYQPAVKAKYWFSEFSQPPKFFVVALVEKSLYLERLSSIEGNLEEILGESRGLEFVKVGIPICANK
ncbi:MAG: hypothetical protein RIC80_17830 [Cyclobacteriaceae bacterium]